MLPLTIPTIFTKCIRHRFIKNGNTTRFHLQAALLSNDRRGLNIDLIIDLMYLEEVAFYPGRCFAESREQ